MSLHCLFAAFVSFHMHRLEMNRTFLGCMAISSAEFLLSFFQVRVAIKRLLLSLLA